MDAWEPEPFLKPRLDSPLARREQVRDAVAAVIDKEAGDPNEAGWMHDRVDGELFDDDELDDYRLQGGFRQCVEAICEDLGLEPDRTGWDDEAGFPTSTSANPAPERPYGPKAPYLRTPARE